MREPKLRVATVDDLAAMEILMKDSIRDLFPAVYTDDQTRSSAEFIGVPDQMLVEDGTFFVIEADGELIACGGWSRRDKLYTGSGETATDARLLDPATEPARVRAMFVRSDWTRRGLGTMILEASEAAAVSEGFRELSLMSTAAGLPLYERCGFVALERSEVPMPDGCSIVCTAMRKSIAT
jgi:GNAT superfamily N-acetyltransferase